MKLMRTAVTILLLLFVGATVGVLIAQEVASPDSQPDSGDIAESLSTTPAIPLNGQTSSDATAPPIELPDIDEGVPTDSGISNEPVAPEASVSDAVDMPEQACVVEAVYYHNTHRCVTCLKIEADARAIVEEMFAEEIAAGTLQWFTINMEEDPSNIVEYGLASPSLVLRRRVGDQVVDWVLLEETWALVRSSTRYRAYIIDSFRAFLEGCP